MTSSAAFRIWRPEQFRDIEVTTGPDPAAILPRHFHEEIQISAYEGGSRKIQIGARTIEATRGHIVVVPSGEPHVVETRYTGGLPIRILLVSPARFAAAALEVGAGNRALLPFAGPAPLFARLRELTRAFSVETPLAQETLFLDFVAGLLEVSQSAVGRRSEPRAIRLAVDYLRAHYDESVMLDDLALQVGLNKHYLVRAFHKAVGVPPHAYQLQLRISRARAALRDGQAVVEVAAALGFADQSHFARTFQRNVGIAPGLYLKHFRALTRSSRSPLT